MHMTIEIKGSLITVETKSPVHYKKDISPQAFIDAITTAFVEEEDEDMDIVSVCLDNTTPILPKGTIAYKGHSKVPRYATAMLIPGKSRPLKYFNEVITVPYPDLVFVFRVNNQGNVIQSQVFAVENCLVGTDTALYRYPFSNVYSNGTICWGTNHLGKMLEPKQLDSLPYLFFEAENNNHEYNSSSHGMEFWELLKSIEDKPVFPTNLLEPLLTNQPELATTFGDIWKTID